MTQFYRSNNKLGLDEDHYPKTKTYRAVSDNYVPDAEKWSGGYPYATVDLTHMRHESHTPNDFRLNVSEPETELFTSKRAQAKISGAYANPAMRHHIPHLLAIAKQDHPDVDFVSDSALTQDSSKLAKHGIAKGLVQPHHYNLEADSSDTHPLYSTDPDAYKMGRNPYPDETVIPTSEVMKGKQFLRQVLGRGRVPQAAPAPKYDQPRLPGME